MLKILLVDDEKLVRSELQRLVDWAENEMEIVGEAENGHEALRFLENHEVDLMISDLTMPGISGIEFLQMVQERFPRLKIVVMTMHQDFELIQQAVRLGVVDYIAKTQIEKENLGMTLGSIRRRLGQAPGECYWEDTATVVLCLEPGAFAGGEGYCSIGDEIWLRQSQAVQMPLDSRTLRLEITGVSGISYYQLSTKVRDFVERQLFYLYVPGIQTYAFAVSECMLSQEEQRDAVAAQLISPDWLNNDGLYGRILESIPALRMDRNELTVFFYQPYLFCSSYLHLEPAVYFTETGGLFWWYQWKKWLEGLRSRTAKCLFPENSPAFALQKVLQYVDQHYMESLTLPQMLELAVMSKSQFSMMFKERTGKSFVNYLKHLRIEQAKKLLRETVLPVSQIGERVGYSDERYFRRVFIECEKCTPPQYRRQSCLRDNVGQKAQ